MKLMSSRLRELLSKEAVTSARKKTYTLHKMLLMLLLSIHYLTRDKEKN